ncbi:MAG: DUF6081 family protein [Myxococcota bacterium]|nr:DUF6081 family protein [Myxococcota bacterium]
MGREIVEVGDFGSIIRGGADASWVPASFPTGDGSTWVYQEPDAVVGVQDGALSVAAYPFTRQHDRVQFFDNAKHMYFSTRQFTAPEGGRLTVEWELAARILRGLPGDLYDGFVSFHLMDLARGVALNFFVGNDVLATVQAHLPFPGAKAPERPRGPKYFAWFEEHEGLVTPGAFHHYAIAWDRAAGTLTWRLDGQVLKHEEEVGELGPFHLAMGLMTEKDIEPGKGSVSCHGQGAVGKWRGIRAVLESPEG